MRGGCGLTAVDSIFELPGQSLCKISTGRVRRLQHSLHFWAPTCFENLQDKAKDGCPLHSAFRRRSSCLRASRAFQEIAGLVGQREPKEKKSQQIKQPDIEVDLDQLMSQGTSFASVASGWLPPPPNNVRPRAVFNASTLAYLGDGIYQLYAQRHFLLPPKSVNALNEKVLGLVRCETQAAMLRKLLDDSDFLTEEERRITQWGKNAAQDSSRKAIRRAGGIAYGQATALETLIGYLYLTDAVRLDAVMTHIGFGFNSAPIALPEETRSEDDTTVELTHVSNDLLVEGFEKELPHLEAPKSAS